MFKVEKSIENVVNNHCEYGGDANQKLIEQLNTRYPYFIEKSQSFLVEDYIENEWRDSYELYYARSHYEHCNSFTKRVHFIASDIERVTEIQEEDYVGYITLRPIPLNQISRVRFKCTKYAFDEYQEGEDIYCLSMNTRVNLPHLSLEYTSFPIFCQDSMVGICAHSSVVMLSKYMYKRFNFNNYRLKDIIQNNSIFHDSGRKVPSEGLTVDQIINILTHNNYNPVLAQFIDGMYNGHQEYNISLSEYIESYLESALPVIVACHEHVSIVIGHIHNDKKHYIIADDSTYHVSHIFGQQEANVAIIPEEEFIEKVTESEDVFVIAPTVDRFYLHYKYLKIIVEEQKRIIKNEIAAVIEVDAEDIKVFSREILVESAYLKQFLHEMGENRFENIVMPHYVWYIEFYLEEKSLEGLSFFTIVNASSHKLDRNHSIMRHEDGDSIVYILDNENKQQLSLLSKLQ